MLYAAAVTADFLSIQKGGGEGRATHQWRLGTARSS